MLFSALMWQANKALNICKRSPGEPMVSWKKMIVWRKGAQQFYLLTYNERKKLRLNLKQPLG